MTTCDYCKKPIESSKVKTRYYTGGTKDIIQNTTVPMLFICRRCGGSFCADHRLPENHECNLKIIIPDGTEDKWTDEELIDMGLMEDKDAKRVGDSDSLWEKLDNNNLEKLESFRRIKTDELNNTQSKSKRYRLISDLFRLDEEIDRLKDASKNDCNCSMIIPEGIQDTYTDEELINMGLMEDELICNEKVDVGLLASHNGIKEKHNLSKNKVVIKNTYSLWDKIKMFFNFE